MDKLIYFLAGLSLGHILSNKKDEKSSSNGFVFFPESLVQQMQQMQHKQMQPPAPTPTEPIAGEQKDCTFRCWLCDGTTSFNYESQPGPFQAQVECSRCGMENVVQIS